jgi:hypothetical protein
MASRGFPITQQMRLERRKRAEERQAEYDKLTLQEKLDRLPPEPAAKKQRAKLLKAIEDAKKPQPKVENKTTPTQQSSEQTAKQTQKKYMKGAK